ncbi:MAG TPA: hypothetical protein VMY39_10720 [Planctomycetota bacterium]|nr:hypothetical protein [Planctomycetota bacterium]
MTMIFSDGFESGDFSAWTGIGASGGDASPSVTGADVLHGQFGLHGASVGAGTGCYAYKTLDTPRDEVWYRFNVELRTVEGDDGHFGHVGLLYSPTMWACQWSVFIVGGAMELRMRPLRDGGGSVWMTGVEVELERPYCVEGWLKRASAPAAGDGEARFYVDGKLVDTQTDIGNYAYGQVAAVYAYTSRLSVSPLTGLVTQTDDFALADQRIGPLRGCRVYHNSGVGPVDYDTVRDVRSEYVDTWTSPALAYPATWRFGVRTFNEFGEERNVNVARDLVLVASGEESPPRPNRPTGLQASAAPGGKVEVTFDYDATDESAACSHFHVYHDAGTGEVDYATEVGSVDLDDGVLTHYAFLTDALSDGVTYRFAVRAAAADDVEDTGTEWVEAVADDAAPDQPATLAGQVVR